MASDVLGVILLLVGGGLLLLSLLVGVLAIALATTAPHGGRPFAVGLILATLCATAGLACLLGGIVSLFVRTRGPGGSTAPHDG